MKTPRKTTRKEIQRRADIYAQGGCDALQELVDHMRSNDIDLVDIDFVEGRIVSEDDSGLSSDEIIEAQEYGMQVGRGQAQSAILALIDELIEEGEQDSELISKQRDRFEHNRTVKVLKDVRKVIGMWKI